MKKSFKDRLSQVHRKSNKRDRLLLHNFFDESLARTNVGLITKDKKQVFFGLEVKTPVANLIKHFTIVIYDSRVVLTTNLPILRL